VGFLLFFFKWSILKTPGCFFYWVQLH